MSSLAVACPQCQHSLRSNRPLRPQQKVRCPFCQTQFAAPAAGLEPASASLPPAPAPAALSPEQPSVAPAASSRSPTSGALIAGAIFLSLLLGSGIIAGALYLAIGRSPPPSAAPNNEEAERIAAERKKLEEERTAFALAKEKKRDEVVGEAPEVPEAAPPGAGLDKTAEALKGLLEQGRKALADKQYAVAVRTYERARELAPTDAVVLKELAQAQAASDADAAEKKKLADYRVRMDAGRIAFNNERFADAVREYQGALDVVPGDPDALAGQRKAEGRIAALNALKARDDRFAGLIDRARKSLAEKRFNAAIADLREAVRPPPEDRDAKEALRKAESSLKKARAEYTALVAKGNELMRLRRYEEAYRQYVAAEEAWAEDGEAAKGKVAALRASEDYRLAQVAYARFMTQGADALAARRYADAATAYQEALRLNPGDARATEGLRRAQAVVVRAARNKADYDKQMRLGSAALNRQFFVDAVNAFSAALKAAPGDPDATSGLSDARFGRFMADGKRALMLKRRDDAINAFKKALDERPDDVTAKLYLRQAQALRF